MSRPKDMDVSIRGAEIVRELQRTAILPIYHHKDIQYIKSAILNSVNEFGHILEAIPSHKKDTPGVKHRLQIQYLMTSRWKRYIAVYLYERWRRVRALYWAVGRHVPHEVKQTFSQHETTAFQQYQVLLTQYSRDSEIDVLSSWTPPSNLMVEIDVIEKVGEFQTETGVRELQIGTRHFVKRRDVEQYLRQGLVREVNSVQPGSII